MPSLLYFAECAAVAVALGFVFLFAWRRSSHDTHQPIVVYVISYLFTYCIGGMLIGVSDGSVLTTYFRDRIYIPSIAPMRVEYWSLLLAPLVVPALFAAMFSRRRRTPSTVEPAPTPALWQFAGLFVALASYAVYAIFRSGLGALEALTNITQLYGDTATIIERRLELFDVGTTATLGIIYSALPALCHVALFRAKQGGRSWRAAAGMAFGTTLALSLATYQIGPAAVLVGASFLSFSRLGFARMTVVKNVAYGLAFLALLQLLNSWKFGDWAFSTNVQHLIFRMPAAFPYYLDCFPGTVSFPGADWLGALTGHGLDPGTPFVVARYMYPNGLTAGAMAAPAQVQGYAEGGLAYGLGCVTAIGLMIIVAAALQRKSKSSAIWHAMYMQSLVALYYSTQTSFRGVVWHSYGIYWSVLALGLAAAVSHRPRLERWSKAVAATSPVGMRPMEHARLGTR